MNNTVKAFFSLFLGIFFGLPTLYFLLSNGYFLGVFVAFFLESESVFAVLTGLLPHGIFELGAIFLATALGFRIGVRSFGVVFRGRVMGGIFVQSMKLFFCVVVPVLLLAAFVEVYVTGSLSG